MCRLLIVSVACLLIILATAGLYMIPKITEQKIEQRLQLKIGTKSFDRFTKVPIPLTVKFYLFNITNAEQVLRGSERPKFEQVGPFMYKQWRRREIIDIIDDNRRITYKEIKTFYPMFEQRAATMTTTTTTTMSNRSSSSSLARLNNEMIHNSNRMTNNHNHVIETDSRARLAETGQSAYLNPSDFKITTVNVPLLSVLTKLANLDEGLKRVLAKKIATNLILDGREKILISKKASEILFDGYKVGLMEAAEDLISTTLGFNFESPLHRNKFGFFYMKNDTWNKNEAGEMTVFTGRNGSMKDFMLVDNWNGLRKLSVWAENTVAGDRCNQIRGSDGSQFHPGVSRQQVLSIFSPMICTSIDVHYKSDTLAKGIPLLRFSTAPATFGAPKKHPQSACYCTIADRPAHSAAAAGTTGATPAASSAATGAPAAATAAAGSSSSGGITQSRCYLDGLLDLSLCQKGAPIAASSPHFFQADPMLAMAAGLEPNASAHETYLDIEPMSGAVMRAASRAQLNAYVESAALNVIGPNVIGHMTPMVAPLLWLEESAEIDDKSANEFKTLLLNRVRRIKCLCTGAIIVALVILIATSLHWFYYTCYRYDGARKRPPPASSSVGRRREQPRAARRAQLDANLRNTAARNGARATKGDFYLAGKAAGAAVVLGAADAAPARNRRRRRRADYEDEADSCGGGGSGGGAPNATGAAAAAAADSSDADSSKQVLVSNEWPQAATTSSASSPASSSSSSSASSAASSFARPTGGAMSNGSPRAGENDNNNNHNNNNFNDDDDDDDERRDLIGGPITSTF